MRSRLYTGEILHTRLRPVRHSFTYPAFAFALDLDELDLLAGELALFSHNRPGVVSLWDKDHLGPGPGGIRDKLDSWLRRSGSGLQPARVELLTTPRVLGHTFNPVSFFFCYDEGDRLRAVVAEVNNTFGEGHVYVLTGRRDARDRLRQRAPKAFHVSPFNDRGGSYDFVIAPLEGRLEIGIDLHGDSGIRLVSRLRGRARELTRSNLVRLLLSWPLTTFLTLPRILWQAFKLHYIEGLEVHTKPEPDSPFTYRAGNPTYISELAAPSWLRRRRPAAYPPESRETNR